MPELNFDIVIHLVGMQTVPNYMAIRLSESPRHLLVTTSETIDRAEMLRRVCAEEGRRVDIVQVPAMEYSAVKAKIEEWLSGAPASRIGFNITGGTKPMSAAALDVCRERATTPFYMDTDNRKIYLFSPPYAVLDMPPVFDCVADFARIAGYSVSNAGFCAQDLPVQRRALLRSMWDCRKSLSDATKFFSRASDSRKHGRGESLRSLYDDAVDKLERIAQSSMSLGTLISNWRTNFPECSLQAAQFGGGGWFEQWLLCQFADSKCAASFLDLRSGLSLKFGDESDKDAQEIDMAYTDGYNLWIFECKSGSVEQSHIQKLENIRRGLGGAMGRGVLCSVHKPSNEVVLQRIEFGDLALVAEDALPFLAKSISNIRPRKNYVRAADFK